MNAPRPDDPAAAGPAQPAEPPALASPPVPSEPGSRPAPIAPASQASPGTPAGPAPRAESHTRADSMERLEAAIELYLAWRSRPDRPPQAEFLAAHAPLRDLLEPLFADAAATGAAEPSAGPAGTARDTDVRLLGGDFALGAELGRGGMGVVFAARQLSLDREVAVKVLAGPATSARALARFRREAATAGRLSHAGIVAIHGVGSDGDVHWIAMERIDGEPLDAWAARQIDAPGRRDLRAIVGAVAQVADALHCAHQAGVLHRDVKPTNVLVRRDGRPVLTDFGLARERDLPALSHTGEFAGTPYYVSPEQAVGAPLDARSDVFSLGVTAYELLTGARPFQGSTHELVLREILTREPLDPKRREPELPSDLAAIVLMALEKDPARRYPDAAAFAADLRAFLAFRPVRARRAGPWRRLVRSARREPLKAALVAVLAIGTPALATLGVVVWRQRDAAEVGALAIRRSTVDELLLDAARARFLQDVGAAERLFDRVLDLGGGDEPIAVVAAALHHGRLSPSGRMHDPGRVLTILDRHQHLADREPALLRLRARALRSLGRDAEARELDAQGGAPRTALDHYVRGYELWNAVDQGDEASLAPAIASLRRAMLLADRPNPVFVSTLGALAGIAGDAEVEREAVDALEHHWPGSPIARIAAVMYWYERDDAACALAAEQLVAAVPDYYWGHFKCGEMAERAGDLDAALAHYDAALARFTGDLQVPFCIGRTHQAAGRPDAAIPWFERVLAMDPTCIPAALHLVETLMATGQDTSAAGFLRGLSRFAPERADVQRVVANYALERRAALAADAPGAEDLLDIGREAATRAVELTAARDASSLRLAARAAELGGDAARATELQRAAERVGDG